jgi:hypothetical protein
MDFGYNSTRFERDLRLEIEKRRNEIALQIVSGSGVNDWSDYRRLCGYVAAFEEVLRMADDIRDRLQKPQE